MAKILAVMTSGGDAPGMNAAIRAVVRRGLDRGLIVYGITNGYEGLVSGGEAIRQMAWHDVGGVLPEGGTFLGTARSERFRGRDGRQAAVRNLLQLGVTALVVIGGDGSLTGAAVLAEEWPAHLDELCAADPQLAPAAEAAPALRVIGLPGSIDNDLFGTDMSIGADTALNHILRAMDNLGSTAASHQRTFVVETMGRHCGYLALMATLGGGASWVLVPEEELGPRWHRKMVEAISQARETGRPHQMVIVAEGARHADGLQIHAGEVKNLLGQRLGIDVRLTVLGHIQRGGAPTAFDRILATRLGSAAVDRLLASDAAPEPCMLGLVKNQVQATALTEVLEKSRAVKEEIDHGNYARAQELRGESFRRALTLVKTLTRIRPARERRQDGAVAILTGGGDAPGMNATVSVAARCLLNQGMPVLGAEHGFLGLIKDELRLLEWNALVTWMNRPSSEIGTARTSLELDAKSLARIAANLERRRLKGLIAIGGWDVYLKILQLQAARADYPSLNIPMVLVPATIDNNLPGTDFAIGADTGLNNIVEAVDKIRHTAAASKRAFIVEVMGRRCGFLALMGALAAGAEKAYLPENGVHLSDLVADVAMLRHNFAKGKRMVILLRNENCSPSYTTDFIQRLLEEESCGQFEVRTAILGHLQRGGIPTAFDRILASRMGAAAAFDLLAALEKGDSEIHVLGLRGPGVSSLTLEEAVAEMDVANGRPRQQWFMELTDMAETLAQAGPDHC
jgi:6-phosphofructokinase 1